MKSVYHHYHMFRSLLIAKYRLNIALTGKGRLMGMLHSHGYAPYYMSKAPYIFQVAVQGALCNMSCLTTYSVLVRESVAKIGWQMLFFLTSKFVPSFMLVIIS